jgi:hypothetical protein
MIRENSVKYPRRSEISQQQNNNESNNNNKTPTTTTTTTNVEQKRGFINFSAAKERQKTKVCYLTNMRKLDRFENILQS